MVSAVLLGVVLSQPRTVTFEHACAHSSVVLAALGEAVGEKMAPGGSVLKDYFAVKLTDRPIDEALRVIAETLNAEWLRRGEYLVLDRGAKHERLEDERQDAVIREAYERYLSAWPGGDFNESKFRELALEVSAAGGGYDYNTPAMRELMKHTPSSLGHPKILRAIGLERILSLKAGEKFDYTLRGDGTSDMPPTVAAAVDEYLTDCAAANGIASGAGVSLSLPTRPVSEGTFVISVSRADNSASVMIRSSRVLHSGGELSSMYSIVRLAPPIREPKRPPLPPLTGRLDATEPARSLIRVAASKIHRNADGVPPLTMDERRAGMTAATELSANEVLGVYAALPLQRASNQWNRDYVALIGDDLALSRPWLTITDTATLEQVWQSWCSGFDVSVDQATGVLKVVPDDPKSVRERRFDRRAAGQFAKRFVGEARITLDAAAELALASGSEPQFRVNEHAAAALLPTQWPGWGWAALRTYGALNPGQKAAAERDGVVIEWENLPRLAREALESDLKSSSFAVSEEPPEPVLWHTFSVTYKGPIRRIELQSVPAGTKVRVFCWRTTGLMPKVPMPENDYGVYTAEQFARFGSKGPIRNEGDTGPPVYGPVAVVSAERVQVEVYVPGHGYTAIAAHVSSDTELTEFTPISRLPEPWRTRLAEAIKKHGGGSE